MATTDTPAFETDPNPLPRPFAVAAWLGMSPQEIMAGLEDGSIARPPGAPSDWSPPGMSIPLDSRAALNLAPSPESDGRTPITYPPIAVDPPSDNDSVQLGRTMVQGWLQSLDPKLTDSSFDAIWSHAGTSDTSRAANLTGYLARALLGVASPQAENADASRAQVSARIAGALSTFTADPSHHAHVVDLAGMNGAQLANLARTDVGYRYALSQLDTVALTENRALFATANADSVLDRFDPDSGESQLSDAWLADRGKFLAWKMAGDAGNDLTIDGDQSWSFIDRSRMGADGQPLTLKLTARMSDDHRNQVIFGADGAESIKGQAGTDRIYGGGGDDVLRGAAGADHLEGGHGDDLVMGGSGNDELAGNQGNDELDGGRGADTLEGGSGDDTLTGGRGDDRLTGGDGADTYVIDAGDGTDTITDTDGRGAIALDDETITGATRNQNGTWTSADGRLDYSLDGDLADEGTLTVRAFAAGASHSGNPDNVIHVRNWHNGDLGITLGANVSAEQTFGAQDSGAPDTGQEPIADDFPADVVSTPGSGGDAGSASAGTGMLGEPDVVLPAEDTGQAAATDSPQLDAAPAAQSFDINDALTQLLEPPNNDGTAVDPTQLQHAVTAFTGVLLPPDVSFGGTFCGNHGSSAVSIADVTGALADDAGGHDFGHEAAAGLTALPPEWHRTEGVASPFDGVARGAGNGMVVARR